MITLRQPPAIPAWTQVASVRGLVSNQSEAKLDVPKEWFISYPTPCQRCVRHDGRLGHRPPDPAAGRPAPWVRQSHNQLDPAFGRSPAEAYDAYLTSERESRDLTEHALRTWTPPRP